MNICIVSNFNFFAKAGGGAGQATFDLVRTLALNPVNNILYIFPGKYFKSYNFSENITFQEIECKFSNTDSAVFEMTQNNINKIESILNEFKPNYIHSQFELYHAQIIQNYSNKNKIPFYLHLHILPNKLTKFISNTTPNIAKIYLNSQFFKKQLLTFYNHCTALILLNDEAVDDIKKFGYKGKILVVPNPIFFFSIDNVLREKGKLIYIGHLSRRKNQEFLINMMNYLPDTYRLTLVGKDLEKEYALNLRKDSKGKNIKFISQLEHDEIKKELLSASVFVSASILEVQSLVMLEAMSLGLPIVALENETTREYLKNYSFVINKDSDPSIFAHKVEEVNNLSNSEYEKLRQEMILKVQKNKPENILKAYSELYKDSFSKQDVRLESKFYFEWSKFTSRVVAFLA